jgi:hypothetical protein
MNVANWDWSSAVNGIWSFGAGGFLLGGAILFYVKVWLPEQARQTKFNTDWIGRLDVHIQDLEKEMRAKEAEFREELERRDAIIGARDETIASYHRSHLRHQRRIGLLERALIDAGIPIPEDAVEATED